MRRLLLVAGLAYLLGLWSGTLFAAERCVSLTVRPTAMLISSDVDVQVRVTRHEDHRLLSVAWDSDTGNAGSRLFALEGGMAASSRRARRRSRPRRIPWRPRRRSGRPTTAAPMPS